MNQYTNDPITRFGGHGKIEIFYTGGSDGQNVYFQVPDPRGGLETYCEGRNVFLEVEFGFRLR